MSSILLYLILLVAGAFLSYRGVVSKKVFDKVEHIQMACLYILLFTMGLRIGMDDRVIKAFLKIGIHATLYAAISVVFSVVMVLLLRKLYMGIKGVRS